MPLDLIGFLRYSTDYDLVDGFGWAELPTRQTPLIYEQAKGGLWNFVRNVAPCWC